MASQILTSGEWDQILEKLLSLFETNTIPYKEPSVQTVITFFAVIGELYQDPHLLEKFEITIAKLDSSSRLTIYKNVAERLYKSPSLQQAALKYFRLYLDVVNEKVLLAIKYMSIDLSDFIFSLEPCLAVTNQAIFTYAFSISKTILSQVNSTNKIKYSFRLANILLDNDKVDEARDLIASASELAVSSLQVDDKVESIPTCQIEILFAKHAGNKAELQRLFDFFFQQNSFLTSFFFVSRCLEIIDYFYSIHDVANFTGNLDKILNQFRYKEEQHLWDSDSAEKNLIHGYLPLLIDYCSNWDCLDKLQFFKNLFSLDYIEGYRSNQYLWDSRILWIQEKFTLNSSQDVEAEVENLLKDFNNSFKELIQQLEEKNLSSGSNQNKSINFTEHVKKIINVLNNTNSFLPQSLSDLINSAVAEKIEFLGHEFINVKESHNETKINLLFRFFYSLDFDNLLRLLHDYQEKPFFDQFYIMTLEFLKINFSRQLTRFQLLHLPPESSLLDRADQDSRRNFSATLDKINTLFIEVSITKGSNLEPLINELDEYFTKYNLDFSNKLVSIKVPSRSLTTSVTLDYSKETDKELIYDFIYTKLFISYMFVLVQGSILEKSKSVDKLLSNLKLLDNEEVLQISLGLATSGYFKESRIFLEQFLSHPSAINWDEDQKLYPPKSSRKLINSSIHPPKSVETASIDKVRVYRKLQDFTKATDELDLCVRASQTLQLGLNQLLIEALHLEEIDKAKAIVTVLVHELNTKLQQFYPVFSIHRSELLFIGDKPDYCSEALWLELKTFTIQVCEEIFSPTIEDLSSLTGFGHLVYVLDLFRKLGVIEESNRLIKKVEAYYSIVKGRLPAEKQTQLPDFVSDICLSDQEVSNLDQVLGSRPVLLPKAMSPVEHFNKRRNTSNEEQEHLKIVLVILSNYYKEIKDPEMVSLFNTYKSSISALAPEIYREKTDLFRPVKNSNKEELNIAQEKEIFYQLFEKKLEYPSKYIEFYDEILGYLKRIADLSMPQSD